MPNRVADLFTDLFLFSLQDGNQFTNDFEATLRFRLFG